MVCAISTFFLFQAKIQKEFKGNAVWDSLGKIIERNEFTPCLTRILLILSSDPDRLYYDKN